MPTWSTENIYNPFLICLLQYRILLKSSYKTGNIQMEKKKSFDFREVWIKLICMHIPLNCMQKKWIQGQMYKILKKIKSLK